MSDSLWPHGLQHARPPCPSPAPRVYSNSCPLSRWCHPTILSSVIPFSSRFLSFPASGFFQMSQLFPSGGQSIGVSASASVLPMNIQDWFPLGWTGWISLLSKGSWVVKSLLQQHNSKASIFQCSAFFMVQLSHLYMTAEKTIALTIRTFASQVMSLGIEMGPLYWECRVLASEPIGKSTLWAFLRHVLTFSEAGLFTSLSLHPETFSLVQAYSSQKRFSLESAVSGSRMKFSTPFNF